MNDLFHWMALHLVPGIGAVTFRRLIERFRAPRNVFAAKAEELAAIKGLKMAAVEAIRGCATKARAEQGLRLLEKYGVDILTFQDEAYPKNLAEIYDAPALLYVKGKLTEADNLSVSVVGSRHATHYGKQITEEICHGLVRYGLTVISGMARGIDTAAHLGALSGKGRTVAVMGSGLDVIYPPENEKLYGRISENGAVVSEYPFGTPPEPRNFPIRNRIISGMALGTVVVEAAQKSGSLITAHMALEQGREVFAVPGSVNSLRSSGTHNLIKQGAKLVERAEDIVEELASFRNPCLRPLLQDQPVTENNIASSGKMDPEEQSLLEMIEDYPQHIDELVRRGSLTVQKVSSMLVGLEIKGFVQQLPGKLFIRK